jgi:hypothetical protein
MRSQKKRRTFNLILRKPSGSLRGRHTTIHDATPKQSGNLAVYSGKFPVSHISTTESLTIIQTMLIINKIPIL